MAAMKASTSQEDLIKKELDPDDPAPMTSRYQSISDSGLTMRLDSVATDTPSSNSPQDILVPDDVTTEQHQMGTYAHRLVLDALSSESLSPLTSTNQYAVRKMAAQALMDVALMMANISQLRILINTGPSGMEYYYLLLVLVALSLISQIVFGMLIFLIWVRESDHKEKEEYIRSLKQNGLLEPGDELCDVQCKLENLRRCQRERRSAYEDSRITNHLNQATTVLVFAITVTNMFITGFGIKLEETTRH